jgi:hypothetical protein
LPDESIRDADGSNILFCKLGLSTGLSSLILRDMTVPLTETEKHALADEAQKQGWGRISAMTDEEILQKYSTTPQYEPQWFAGNIRRAAGFADKYSSA